MKRESRRQIVPKTNVKKRAQKPKKEAPKFTGILHFPRHMRDGAGPRLYLGLKSKRGPGIKRGELEVSEDFKKCFLIVC